MVGKYRLVGEVINKFMHECGHAYAVTREGVKARGYHEAPAHAREACTIDGLF